MADPTKPYELTFDPRPEYFYVRVTAATIDEDSAAMYLRDIAAKCRELNYAAVLLERDIPVMLPPGGLYFTTKGFREMMDGIKVAIVNPHAELDEKMKFAMLMAENIGAQFSLQPSIDAAEDWLLANIDNDDDDD
jgi:hypothetical protein